MERIRVRAGFADIVGHGVLWMVLSVVTLGLALLAWPYYAFRFVLSRSVVVDPSGREVGRMEMEGGLSGYLGHAILWALGILVTLGLAAPIWIYDVYRKVLSETKVVREG